jgi:FkbM family methyltransferase
VKNKIKYILQKLLGYQRYLHVFAKFKILTLKFDRKEKDFFHFMKVIPKHEGIILDIGANIGIMTYHLSKNFSQNYIHAIEPVPSNVEILKKIIKQKQLKNVSVHALALGTENSTVKMILPFENNVYFQGLSHVKHESITEKNEGKEFEVEMKTLDDLFPNKKIIAIKIDVENFEYFVLKGGEKILKIHHPIIYAELWDNENRTNCFHLLHSMNYKTFVIEKNQLVSYNSSVHQKQNFIFIVQ